MYIENTNRKKPFIFFNMWVKAPRFLETVKAVWDRPMNGWVMYYVMKDELKKINKEVSLMFKLDLSKLIRTLFSYRT